MYQYTKEIYLVALFANKIIAFESEHFKNSLQECDFFRGKTLEKGGFLAEDIENTLDLVRIYIVCQPHFYFLFS